jgi:transposase InsO family protein
MRTHGWVGVSGRRRPRTTIVDRAATAAEDLVARNFNPAAPDVTWAGDITYIPTGEGSGSQDRYRGLAPSQTQRKTRDLP